MGRPIWEFADRSTARVVPRQDDLECIAGWEQSANRCEPWKTPAGDPAGVDALDSPTISIAYGLTIVAVYGRVDIHPMTTTSEYAEVATKLQPWSALVGCSAYVASANVSL